MKCGVCGCENREGNKRCITCGSDLGECTQKDFSKYCNQDALFVGHSSEFETNPLRNGFRIMAKGRLLRGAALFYTIAVTWGVLCFASALKTIERIFVAEDFFHIDSPHKYKIFVMIMFWSIVLPQLFTIFGVWISIFSASGKKEMTPLGIDMIKVSKSLEMVEFMCVIFVLIISQIAKPGLDMYKAALLVGIFALLIPIIICYNGIFISLKNIKYSILNEDLSENLSDGMMVMCIVVAVISMLFGGAAILVWKNAFVGIGAFVLGVSQCMFASFIVRYNNFMEWIYHSGWEN